MHRSEEAFAPEHREEDGDFPSRLAWTALSAIILIGAVLRFYKLDAQCIWMDELASLGNARAFGNGGLRALATADHIAPLHSIILWLSTSFLGETAFAMRLPSALFGIMTIPAIYVVALRIFRSSSIALISAAIVCLSPYAIWFSQEARMYSLLLLSACLYVAVAWTLTLRKLHAWELAALIVLTALGLYAHHYMALLSASFGIFLLIQIGFADGRFWQWLAAQIIAFLAFSYWILLTADKLGNHAGFPKPAEFLWIPYTFISFATGLSFGPSTRELRVDGVTASLSHHVVELTAISVAMAIIFWLGIRSLRASWPANVTSWLFIWLSTPIFLAIIATLVTNISYNARYVIVSYPAFVLIAAVGLKTIGETIVDAIRGARTPLSSAVAGALAVVLLLFCVGNALRNQYWNPLYEKEDVRPLARELRSGVGANTIFVADNSRIVPLLMFYGARISESSLAVDNILWGRTAPMVTQSLAESMNDTTEEILFVRYRSWETDPGSLLEKYLNTSKLKIDTQMWPGVSLTRYRTRAVL